MPGVFRGFSGLLVTGGENPVDKDYGGFGGRYDNYGNYGAGVGGFCPHI